MKIINKERASQRLLYKQLYIKFFTLAERYSEDHDAANRVFNDAMMKIYRYIETNPKSELSFALFSTIIKNTAIDSVRKNMRYKKHLKNYKEIKSDDHSTLNLALDRLNVQQLLSIIDTLDYNKRTVFYLKEVDGLSHEEISERIGIKIGYSKYLLSKAKEELRQKIKQHFPELKLRS